MKITWIMQVYLGDYPNSPKNHDKKFRRAVKSFLAMKDKDTSLVIVSDGCQLAHEIYFKEFAKHKNIKYAFVEKTTPKMYEEYKGQELSEYHRVGPRQLGRMIEDSDLVAYLDSDDFLLPDASVQIREFWQEARESGNALTWSLNSRWYDSSEVNKYIENTNYHGKGFEFGDLTRFEEPIKIKSLRGNWQEVGIENYEKYAANYAMNIVHKSSINISWRDSVTGIKNGIKPDVSFIHKVKKLGGLGIMTEPYYVRCHRSNLWDK